jgi:hypothetical protein
VRLFFQQKEVALAQKISGSQSAETTADDHHIVPGGDGRPREDFAVAYLVADAIIFPLHQGRVRVFGLRSERREVNWASRGNRSGDHELDEISAIRTHPSSP